MSGYDPNVVMEQLTTEDCIDIAWVVLEGGDPLAYALEIVGIEETTADMTEVGIFMHAKGIDGQTVINEEHMTDNPHGYALAFVSRERMIGDVSVSVSNIPQVLKLNDDMRWTYIGHWRSFDDEPYELLLVAEFTERVRS